MDIQINERFRQRTKHILVVTDCRTDDHMVAYAL